MVDIDINDLKDLIDNNLLEKIKEFKNEIPQQIVTLQHLVDISKNYDRLKNEVDSVSEYYAQIQSNDASIKEQFYATTLVSIYINELYVRIILNFIQFVQKSSKPESILFANVQLVPSCLKKRYHLLCKLFHPDRICAYRSVDAQTQINDFSSFINNYYNQLAYTLDTKDAEFFERKGDTLFKIANDYRKCSMQKWNELKILIKNELPCLTPKEYQAKATYFGLLAFEEYKEACKIVDSKHNFAYQFRYRKCMALCLYICEKPLEAQILAISLFHLIGDSKPEDPCYNEAQNLLKKIKGLNTDDVEQMEEINLTESQIATYGSRNEYLKKVSTELFLTPKLSIARVNTPISEIMEAQKNAAISKAKAISTAIVGVGAAGTIVAAKAAEIAGAFAGGVMMGGPVLAISASVLSLGASFFLGKYFLDKSARIYKEPKIRENLNKILMDSVDAYNKNDYKSVLKTLSLPFKEVKKENISILKYDEKTFQFDPRKSIEELISHEVPPDGIAYLFVMIANIMASGSIKVTNLPPKRMKSDACSVLDSLTCVELEKKAQELDNKVSKFRKLVVRCYNAFSERWQGFLNKIGRLISDEYKIDFVPEHMEDARKKGSFSSRLKAIQIIAKLNIAVFTFSIEGFEGKDAIRSKIEEIKSIVAEHELPIESDQETYLRLDILELFLWIVTRDSVERQTMKAFNPPALMERLVETEYVIVQKPDDDYELLHILNEEIKNEQSVPKKIELLIKKGTTYFKIANDLEKTGKIISLQNFKNARDAFMDAYNLDNSNCVAAINVIKCLVKLSDFSDALTFLDTNPATKTKLEDEEPDYWLYMSIAWRKSIKKENHIENADHYISEFFKYKPKDVFANQQKRIVKNLSDNTIDNRINLYRETRDQFKTDKFLNNTRSTEIELFKIISIDGGGIRGIIPSLLLCEIERRAHKQLACMVDMFAGTSTGAIIASGLNIPAPNSPTTPMYSAYDLLDLYINRSKEIFGAKPFKITNFFSDRYTNQGLLNVITEYFGGPRINKSLTELLITAVNQQGMNMTHCFTKRDACKFSIKNVSFVDAIMASTAAPTFFPSYKIDNLGTFLDGGIRCNNPSRKAFEEAIKYGYDKNKIFMLSLGTSDCIPDPFDPEHSKGAMFWAKNLHEVMMSGQDYDTEISMNSILGENCERWQIYLEEPVTLDECEFIPQLLELGVQYIEELDCSDERPIEKIVKLFNPSYD